MHPEYQYLDLLREILEHGDEQKDIGHGKKTYSVFGRQIRFDLSQSPPAGLPAASAAQELR